MAVTDAQIAFVRDLFADIGPITTRKMFGGLGIYSGGTIFALYLSDGSLLLKGAGEAKTAFEAAGWDRWTYTRRDGNRASMPYWHLPDDLHDDPEAACEWAQRSLAAL